jgi:hypothetical protein
MKTATRGAGKPALYGKAMKRINVMLDEETINFYLAIGEGNLSKGVRQHWRSLTKRAADVCHESSDGVHEWYQGSSWLICSHCGTRR